MANIAADFANFNFVDFLYIPLTNHIWAGWIGPIESLCLKRTRCDGGITVALSGGMGRILWGGADKFVRKKKNFFFGVNKHK